jgi:hypothetical protein
LKGCGVADNSRKRGWELKYALRHTTTAIKLIGFSKKEDNGLLIVSHNFLMDSLKIPVFFTTHENGFVKFKLMGGNKSCQPANTSGLLGVVCMLNSFNHRCFDDELN